MKYLILIIMLAFNSHNLPVSELREKADAVVVVAEELLAKQACINSCAELEGLGYRDISERISSRYRTVKSCVKEYCKE